MLPTVASAIFYDFLPYFYLFSLFSQKSPAASRVVATGQGLWYDNRQQNQKKDR
jgi:hypothetical protein